MLLFIFFQKKGEGPGGKERGGGGKEKNATVLFLVLLHKPLESREKPKGGRKGKRGEGGGREEVPLISP